MTITARRPTVRTVAAAVLTVAVFVLPLPLAETASGGQDLGVAAMTERVGSGLTAWVRSGAANPGPDLAATIGLWSVFHAIKAALAAAALVVLALVLRARLTHSRPGHSWPATALATATATVLLLVLVANIQGFLAPLSSATTLLPARPLPGLAAVVDGLTTGAPPLVATALIRDFQRFHSVLAACLAVVLISLAVTGWAVIRSADARRPAARRKRVPLFVVTVAAVICGVLLAANVSTALDPVPALSAFLSPRT